MSELNGRRVLITGAARGIGAATAKRLHSRGARVALMGIEPEQLAEVAAACGDAPWFECDVRDREQVDTAVASAVSDLGGLDVVMANAGIAPVGMVRSIDPRAFERGYDAKGQPALVETGPAEGGAQAIEDYWRRRRERDPDLWVIELDIASAERFAAETIVDG